MMSPRRCRRHRSSRGRSGRHSATRHSEAEGELALGVALGPTRVLARCWSATRSGSHSANPTLLRWRGVGLPPGVAVRLALGLWLAAGRARARAAAGRVGRAPPGGPLGLPLGEGTNSHSVDGELASGELVLGEALGLGPRSLVIGALLREGLRMLAGPAGRLTVEVCTYMNHRPSQ